MSAKQHWENPFKRNRHAERRRIRRRQKFLAKALVSVAPEIFSPEEATDLLFASLASAKRALRCAERRQVVAPADQRCLPPPVQNSENLPAVSQPVRVLSRLNRSSIFPPLVSDEIEVEALSVNEILATFQLKYQDTPAHRFLDAFATASGLSWEVCAEILLSRRLITKPIDCHDLVATRSAREFHNRYGQGRARYAVFLAATKVQEFQGDWAYFDDDQFQDLLPGIIEPTKLKRDHYFTNWVSSDNHSSVDVYAVPTRLPLFRHPFLDDFNPLSFRKPRLNGDRR
jgi:hypothetical protein